MGGGGCLVDRSECWVGAGGAFEHVRLVMASCCLDVCPRPNVCLAGRKYACASRSPGGSFSYRKLPAC